MVWRPVIVGANIHAFAKPVSAKVFFSKFFS
jgi:hypothetical protein